MPVLRTCNQRSKVIRAIERAGFERDEGGKHVVMHHSDGRFTTIPNSRRIRLGTLKAIVKQCGLTNERFIRLYTGKKADSGR